MKGTDDLRISVHVFEHPKVVKLQKRLGAEAVVSLLRLWCWTAANRSRGTLDGMTGEDIEIAARWQGQEGAFFDALLALSLVDETATGYAVHDWAQNQPWAYEAVDRSEYARSLVRKRWDKKKKKQKDAPSDTARNTGGNTPRIRDVSENDTARNTNSNTVGNTPFLSFPFPSSPSLSDLEKTCASDRCASDGDEQETKNPTTKQLSDEFNALWEEYPNKRGKGAAEKSFIRWRKAGYSLEDMTQATRNYAAECRLKGRTEEYIKHGSTFFGPNKPFADYIAGIPSCPGASAPRVGGVRGDMPLNDWVRSVMESMDSGVSTAFDVEVTNDASK